MKVAVLSVYKDGTGYAHGAISTVLACEAAGIPVVCRPITLTGPNGDAHGVLAPMEGRSLDGVTAVIEYSLPHTFEWKAGVTNIGMFTWETTHFRSSSWASHCNMMDRIWVHNLQTARAARRSGVTTPLVTVPIAIDMRRFAERPKPLNDFVGGGQKRCVFYTIAESSRRKNLPGLIRAFYLAFSERDRVVLAIKTHVPGKSPIQAQQEIAKMVEDIKGSIHIYSDPSRYPPVAILTGYWPEATVDRFHATGDVFVSASRGEAWCIPAVDAMAWGNPLIVPNWGAFPEISGMGQCSSLSDYDDTWTKHERSPVGWIVNGQLCPCFGQTGLNDLYTGAELWFDVDLSVLAKSMQEAYDEWVSGHIRSQYSASCMDIASRFDLPKVGHRIRSLLEV